MWQDNEAKKESRTQRLERVLKDVMEHRHTDTYGKFSAWNSTLI